MDATHTATASAEHAATLLGDYMTIPEFAEEVGKSLRTVERWLRAGEGPPTTRIGNTRMIRRKAARAWLESLETA